MKAFTLRFRDPSVHANLRLVAELLGVSMNELAERAIADQLAAASVVLERRLSETLERLRAYRPTEADVVADVVADVEAFARAEVTEDDPLRCVRRDASDDLGVAAIFARSQER